MNELHDLKAVWLTGNTDILPSAEEIVRMGKKFRDQKIRRKIFIACFAIALIALMGTVIFVYHSKMLSTRIGEVLTIIACFILATTNLRSIKRFQDLQDYNNKEFVTFLERTRQHQAYYYKKKQVVAMLLSSVGLIMYLYELVYKQTVALIILYTIVVFYLAFLWFFVRPRIYKKQSKKLDEMIKQLERISKQF